MGFAKAAEALWDPVRDAIQHSVLSGKSVYITGHSLGGAMAVVSALHAHYELHCPIAGLATFGQPPLVGRTGIRSLCSAGLGDYPRIVSSVDVVVTGPLLPFFHSGSIRYFDANEMLHTQKSQLRVFQDAIRHGWRFQVAAQVQRHFMDHYIKLLTGQLAQDTHGNVEAQGEQE
jgi:predicted lipase